MVGQQYTPQQRTFMAIEYPQRGTHLAELLCPRFSVFRAFYILNGYVQSVQMERAKNSDSKTPVKKYYRTSGTDLS